MSDENQTPELQQVAEAFNVGDERHVEKKKRRVKINDNAANSAIRGVMSVPEGRAFFWWLLEECRVHHSSFNTNGLTMAFMEGQRNVGLKLESRLVEACADDFMQMHKEAREKPDA